MARVHSIIEQIYEVGWTICNGHNETTLYAGCYDNRLLNNIICIDEFIEQLI